MTNMEPNKGEIVMYQPDETIRLEVRVENETVWLTQQQMAELFNATKQKKYWLMILSMTTKRSGNQTPERFFCLVPNAGYSSLLGTSTTMRFFRP